MEDKLARERVDSLEKVVKNHLAEHTRFEAALLENTNMTRQIASNTSELVTLVRGAKGLRTFAVWVAPLVVLVGAVVAWIKAH